MALGQWPVHDCLGNVLWLASKAKPCLDEAITVLVGLADE